MKTGFYRFSRSLIFYISMTILAVFSVYLLVMGAFVWFNGGCIAFGGMKPIVRGLCMLAAVVLFFILFRYLSVWLHKQSEQKLKRIALTGGAAFFALQMGFVMLAKAGIRYDSLKVVDEAIALFSQKGISASDLDGYFARYTNNYAMTILTHWFIKIFRAVGLIRRDFSNAVIVLQFINVFFTDVAFLGCYAFLDKYVGRVQAVCFLLYMACNPLSYVWLPFYYTNTAAMPFAVWGIYFLFAAFDLKKQWIDGSTEKSENEKRVYKKPILCLICMFLSGILFYTGYKIRATVGIALIAGLLGQFYRAGRGIQNTDKAARKHAFATCGMILVLIASLCLTRAVYRPVENHYLDFDPTDTAFPPTHWVAMGLMYYGDGSYSAEDEKNTISYPTAREKKEATTELIRQRARELGFFGVCKLYMKKLSNTFGDGAGGYHSELNLSRDYGWIWQVVYGANRDPVLIWTQVFYLLSILCTVFAILFLQKRRIPDEVFVFLLLLTGSYLFQMLWESATIYSIGTMYLNGVMVAVGLSHSLRNGDGEDAKRKTVRNKIRFLATAILGAAGLAGLIIGMIKTDYVKVTMSVNQFLFQAEEYPALSFGQQITQTFQTKKAFSTIAFQVRNYEGIYNSGIYLVSLYDGEGNLLQQQEIIAENVQDYEFCKLPFHNEEGVTDYEIRIEKKSGTEDLIFLYYDTGHYDTYPQGKMTGPVIGDTADLLFEVFDLEEN